MSANTPLRPPLLSCRLCTVAVINQSIEERAELANLRRPTLVTEEVFNFPSKSQRLDKMAYMLSMKIKRRYRLPNSGGYSEEMVVFISTKS